jgi:hypothetical protein
MRRLPFPSVRASLHMVKHRARIASIWRTERKAPTQALREDTRHAML